MLSASPRTEHVSGCASSPSYVRLSKSSCVPHGYLYPSFPFQCTVVFCLASSRSTVHSPGQGKPKLLMSLRSSEGCGGENSGAGVPCTGTIGRTTRDPRAPPSSSEVVIEYGVGSIIGHKAFEIATRTRCPLGKTHEVRCISMSSP